MMLAGIYCRVSTKHQLKEGYSIPEQEAAIAHHVRSKGDTVVQVWHEDISGVTLSRPKLNEILALAKAGGIEVLYAYDLDRLARGPVAVNIIEEQLKQLGVRIEYVRMDFDDTPEGQMLKMIMATFSGYERMKTRERMMRGRKGKAKSGKIASGKRLFGYQFDETGDHYLINETEAHTVRSIFSWYINENMGASKIAQRLNDQHTPSYSGLNWTIDSVGRILRNEVYTGKYAYGKSLAVNETKVVKMPRSEWVIVDIPPIIDDETFKAARQQAGMNKKFSRRNQHHDYLLSGLLYCPTCGYRYYGKANVRSKNPATRFRYMCGGNNSHNRTYLEAQCPGSTLRANETDTLVWNKIHEILTQPERIIEALSTVEATQATHLETLNTQIGILQKQLSDIEKAEKRLIELYAMSDLDKTLVGGQLANYKEQKMSILSTIEDLTAQSNTDRKTLKTEDVIQLCNSIASNIDKFTFEDKRKALKLLEIQVYIDRTKTPYTVQIRGLLPDVTAEVDKALLVQLNVNFCYRAEDFTLWAS